MFQIIPDLLSDNFNNLNEIIDGEVADGGHLRITTFMNCACNKKTTTTFISGEKVQVF